MNKKEAERLFTNDIMPYVKKKYEQDGKPDYPVRREVWNNFTDTLCKNRKITLKQYETWTHPKLCK